MYSSYVCTFPGKFGDILWSLPTAREIVKQITGVPVTFVIMAPYASLVPLLEYQSYIEHACSLPHWLPKGSPHGDVPGIAPLKDIKTEKVWHLAYRNHPNNLPDVPCLIDLVINQQSMYWSQRPVPFLEAPKVELPQPAISYAFNGAAAEAKLEFISEIKQRFPNVNWIDVTKLDWLIASSVISCSKGFLGCRSANYVLATGVGVPVLVYEPILERRPKQFGCPHNKKEKMPNVNDFNSFVLEIERWLS